MLASTADLVDFVVRLLPEHYQHLAASAMLAVLARHAVELFAKKANITGSATVFALSILTAIYASCIVAIASGDRPWPQNLLRIEILSLLLISNLVIAMSLSEDMDDVATEMSFLQYMHGRLGAAIRSGLIAVNVVVLQSALPSQSI